MYINTKTRTIVHINLVINRSHLKLLIPLEFKYLIDKPSLQP